MKIRGITNINNLKDIIINYTYDEFIAGLYAYYHYEPLSSRSFIPSSKKIASNGLSPEDIINLSIDAMKILSSLKNPNKREAFLLMAQGYEYSEIAKKINISETTIRNKYVGNMHKLLDRGVHL